MPITAFIGVRISWMRASPVWMILLVKALAERHRRNVVTVLETGSRSFPAPIKQGDIRDVRFEDGGDLLADELDQCIDVELAANCWDGVRRVEFNSALL